MTRLIQETAFRNGSLQGAYLIVAARMLGLDCGPMSGFDQAGVNAEFFPDSAVKANFLCNLGYRHHGKDSSRARRACPSTPSARLSDEVLESFHDRADWR